LDANGVAPFTRNGKGISVLAGGNQNHRQHNRLKLTHWKAFKQLSVYSLTCSSKHPRIFTPGTKHGM